MKPLRTSLKYAIRADHIDRTNQVPQPKNTPQSDAPPCPLQNNSVVFAISQASTDLPVPLLVVGDKVLNDHLIVKFRDTILGSS